MYFKKGVVYVNFADTEMVRFLGVRGDSILTANLRLSGGTKEFKREIFERDFTEKQDVPKVRDSSQHVKPKTDPKHYRQAKEYAGN